MLVPFTFETQTPVDDGTFVYRGVVFQCDLSFNDFVLLANTYLPSVIVDWETRRFVFQFQFSTIEWFWDPNDKVSSLLQKSSEISKLLEAAST